MTRDHLPHNPVLKDVFPAEAEFAADAVMPQYVGIVLEKARPAAPPSRS